jgi:hypothetical protein
MARDYVIVHLALDGQSLGELLDLSNDPNVISSSELTRATRKLTAGTNRLSMEIKGANPSTLKAFMVGPDCLRLIPR